MDLFEQNYRQHVGQASPLAARMRPRNIDEMVGQEHILAPGKLLYRAIKADKLTSVIFYGPPGIGKTTLARIIANTTAAHFQQVNATIAGKKDLEAVVATAQKHLGQYNQRTILFIDEIHRFNKGQQDYLLPFVEDGTLVLIGATTENPFFEVNGALLSRSRIFELKPLSKENIGQLIDKALTDEERGLAEYNATITPEARQFIADATKGDAREALNALELGVLTTDPDENGKIELTLDVMQECIQKKAIRYDKDGENHYDAISAFIESMKHTDPDATLYYLARMLEAGEDPKYIARRIMVCASEDVGLADSNALNVATSASLAVERIGMPEGKKILAHAAVYVACAPKSDAVSKGYLLAEEEVRRSGHIEIPMILKDESYAGAHSLGRGVGLTNIHAYPNHYANQQMLPNELAYRQFLQLGETRYERAIAEWFKKIGKTY
ncbi:MAG: replication-associated recombination protein A [Paludibacteraceae bacterium]|nr:replication-associated recombination protein A [Paludibacteraceae bacterium]